MRAVSRRALLGGLSARQGRSLARPAGVARGGTGPWRAVGRRSSSSMHALSPQVWQRLLVSPAAGCSGSPGGTEPRRTGDAPQCIADRNVDEPALGWVCTASGSGEILRVVLVLTGSTLPLRLLTEALSNGRSRPSFVTTPPSPFVIHRASRAASTDWSGRVVIFDSEDRPGPMGAFQAFDRKTPVQSAISLCCRLAVPRRLLAALFTQAIYRSLGARWTPGCAACTAIATHRRHSQGAAALAWPCARDVYPPLTCRRTACCCESENDSSPSCPSQDGIEDTPRPAERGATRE